jgi:hypothetical protein
MQHLRRCRPSRYPIASGDDDAARRDRSRALPLVIPVALCWRIVLVAPARPISAPPLHPGFEPRPNGSGAAVTCKADRAGAEAGYAAHLAGLPDGCTGDHIIVRMPKAASRHTALWWSRERPTSTRGFSSRVGRCSRNTSIETGARRSEHPASAVVFDVRSVSAAFAALVPELSERCSSEPSCRAAR